MNERERETAFSCNCQGALITTFFYNSFHCKVSSNAENIDVCLFCIFGSFAGFSQGVVLLTDHRWRSLIGKNLHFCFLRQQVPLFIVKIVDLPTLTLKKHIFQNYLFHKFWYHAILSKLIKNQIFVVIFLVLNIDLYCDLSAVTQQQKNCKLKETVVKKNFQKDSWILCFARIERNTDKWKYRPECA